MTDPIDTAAIQARLEAATPGPWFHNGYSWIGSEPLIKTYDAWIDPLVDADHTLDRTGDCRPCGKWRDPATCHNWPAGHGCRHHSEDYDRDPVVAHVPSHHGDTAIGRHAADMEFIAHAPDDIRALLARIAELEAEVERLTLKSPRLVPMTGSHIIGCYCGYQLGVSDPTMRLTHHDDGRHTTVWTIPLNGPVTPISDTTGDQQ